MDQKHKSRTLTKTPDAQRVWVFQQDGSGESKIAGLRKYGGDSLVLESISIDQDLPPVLDDTTDYLPDHFEADLVLDFLKHPDLSHDLALMGTRLNIPVIASGKKTTVKGILTPPT
jgi:hypothetical protein